MGTNRRILIDHLPQGPLDVGCFRPEEAEAPVPGDGEVSCRTRYLSIDAANRAWMQGATYRSALEGGQVMAGAVLAEVIESKDAAFAPGDIVETDYGWQEQAAVPASRLEKVEVRGPLSHHLSVLGITGLTAYVGLLDIGRPREGETVVVSAAAGAVGNVAAQLAKIAGCRVVGVAGAPEKCAWLVDELDLDGAVSYRDPGFFKALKAACPQGIDVYFDNTGGDVLGAALFQMNLQGRIVCCGVVSQYDTSNPGPGPRGVPGLLVTKRLRMEGFIVMDSWEGHPERRAEATERLAGWVADGRLEVVEDVVEGIEAAPGALVDLLAGGNLGKRLVKVADHMASPAEPSL
ncbi:MAG: zinc-binding dehydrogenase [Acidimicrobiia bacterium]|nr:zinc-binding dehydrogenase [Acidimicrobiia bacterium]